MSKRKTHDLDFKREVLTWIFQDETMPKTSYAAAKRFKAEGHMVSKQCIHGWIEKRNEIMDLSNKGQRVSGGGRPCLLGQDLEDELAAIITEERLEGNRVAGSNVKSWALELAAQNGISNSFCASDGWLSKFLKRNNFSFRRVTNLTSLSVEELIKRSLNFMVYLQKALSNGMNLDLTILMDETAVYLEDPRQVTINVKGKRHVSLRSTGFASMRLTVLLSVTASGRKLPPVLIVKKARATEPKFKKVGGCYVFYNEKAWVNQELIKAWIDIVFPNVCKRSGKALVWDSCRAHTSNLVKKHLFDRKIQNIVVPGGLTPYVQAGDLGIYKSFKDKISPIIAHWKKSDQVQYTRGNNPKPPDVETICGWVLPAWQNVSSNVVLNSIKAAGFGNEQDWMIYKHDIYGEEFQRAWLNRNIQNFPEIEEWNEILEDNHIILDDADE